jgi:hypothetical protein
MGGGVDAHMENGWVQFLIGGVVFHRSTKGKGRKGEEHICLVFKTICTYNLAFKHVHGSLIRLFVSFDKNTPPIVLNRIYICGNTTLCVCAFQTKAPTANVVVYKTTCTRVSIPIALLFPTIGALTDTPLYVHTHTTKDYCRPCCVKLAVPLGSGPSCPSLSSLCHHSPAVMSCQTCKQYCLPLSNH